MLKLYLQLVSFCPHLCWFVLLLSIHDSKTHTCNGICIFLAVTTLATTFQDWCKKTIQITSFFHSPTVAHLRVYREGLCSLENHISFAIDFLISSQLCSKGIRHSVTETSISIIHTMKSNVTFFLCAQFHEGGLQRFNTFLSRYDWHCSGQHKTMTKVNQ